jgi:uncharacterized membrane protein HdeD (DUF308 family)
MSATTGSPFGPDAAEHYWWLPFAAGVLTITVGLIVLIWPGPTLLVVGVVLGAYLTVSGVVTLVRAIGGAEGMHAGLRLSLLLLGVLAVLAGLLLIVRPEKSVLVIAWVIGFWWVVSGVLQLTRGFVVAEGRSWNLGLGLVGIIAGTIILAQPEIGLTALVLISAIGLICQGALEALAGLQLRHLHQEELA